MTDFFSTLRQTGIEQFGISISFNEDTVNVSVLPKSSAKDKALQSLKPLTLRGNVQEVDEKFFQILQKPMQKTKALFRNTVAFEQTLAETEQKTQQAKKKKESASKKATELKQLLKATDFNPMTDHKKATDIANDILKIDPNHKDAQKVVKDMKVYESPKLFT
ncbi:PRTRC system protein E [Ulvibacterium marinum]|uniref:PRTRC system protein E n=1 Tax=Ulvibacterium marinum TaxID=2419782 RepID=A0A3B0CEL0_9FLAO|nr:PRTRC system protein E [Ulvibacterium marinum]RKN83551.1 PRTRC system protein E [Ulvibacterium marinum]